MFKILQDSPYNFALVANPTDYATFRLLTSGRELTKRNLKAFLKEHQKDLENPWTHTYYDNEGHVIKQEYKTAIAIEHQETLELTYFGFSELNKLEELTDRFNNEPNQKQKTRFKRNKRHRGYRHPKRNPYKQMYKSAALTLDQETPISIRKCNNKGCRRDFKLRNKNWDNDPDLRINSWSWKDQSKRKHQYKEKNHAA